jgi:hypothetical protein
MTNGKLSAARWRHYFLRRSVMNFSAAMIASALALVEQISRRDGQMADFSVEAKRVALDVLERTIFSDGLGENPEKIRKVMKAYSKSVGQLDPFVVLQTQPGPQIASPTQANCSTTRCQLSLSDPPSAPLCRIGDRFATKWVQASQIVLQAEIDTILIRNCILAQPKSIILASLMLLRRWLRKTVRRHKS